MIYWSMVKHFLLHRIVIQNEVKRNEESIWILRCTQDDRIQIIFLSNHTTHISDILLKNHQYLMGRSGRI